MSWKLRRAVLGILTAAPVLAGCAGDEPTRFYLLTPLAEAQAAQGEPIAVGVGPIALPRYLVRPEIVTRVTDNELELAEFDQWGGELEDNFTHVLATNIAILLPTESVALFPWGAGPPPPIDFQVLVDITSFERDSNGDCVLTAFWRIAKGDGGEILMTRRSSFREPAADVASYEAIAGAMSTNIERLSREIVDAIRSL
jgi:hypothetical protein